MRIEEISQKIRIINDKILNLKLKVEILKREKDMVEDNTYKEIYYKLDNNKLKYRNEKLRRIEINEKLATNKTYINVIKDLEKKKVLLSIEEDNLSYLERKFDILLNFTKIVSNEVYGDLDLNRFMEETKNE